MGPYAVLGGELFKSGWSGTRQLRWLREATYPPGRCGARSLQSNQSCHSDAATGGQLRYGLGHLADGLRTGDHCPYLAQVRHLSVYHALRIAWPTDGDGGDAPGCGGHFVVGGGLSGAAEPLAALFPGLRHLSACVAHGSPGRAASERWGYLAGLGSRLTSLHLRAVAAEDLCLQVRAASSNEPTITLLRPTPTPYPSSPLCCP